MKQCRTCKKNNVREINGIATSKWCVACRKAVDAAKKERKLKTKKYLKSKLNSLKAKCWKGISAYVRKLGADEFGYNTCYTCGSVKHWKEMNCGHYIHGKLDYDTRNLKCQCVRCNQHLSGNLGEYALRLIKENGTEWIDQLKLDANTHEYTLEDLEAIYIKYKEYAE